MAAQARADYQAVKLHPEKIIIEKERYHIEVEPIRIPYSEGWGPKAFKVRILNRHTSDLTILWKETTYLTNGKVDGVFCTYGDKKEIETEVVLPGKSIERDVSPAHLLGTTLNLNVFFSTGSWRYHSEFPIGMNGISLSILIDNERLNEQGNIDFILK